MGEGAITISLECHQKNIQVQRLAHLIISMLFLSHSSLSPEMTKSFIFHVLSSIGDQCWGAAAQVSGLWEVKHLVPD